jgi:hypothetical protein
VGTSGAIATLAAGTATITAQSGGKSAAATLTVNAVAPPPPPPPPSGTGAVRAAGPTKWVNSAYVAPTGNTITLKAGDNLQAAVNNAQRGDVILLPPGVTFTGGLRLPNKPGTGWITIRSATPDAQLPAAGQRITPAHAALLPKVVTNNNGIAVSTDPGARFYRLMFLEITVASPTTNYSSLIRFGDPSSDQTGVMPSDLILDRSYVHGLPTGEVKSCVILSSAWSAIVDSWISECKDSDQDSQAVVGWNGSGPYKINNNYLEGAGENVMFGGATPHTPGNLPSDIEFRNNHLKKQDAWKSGGYVVKNLFEVKFGKRILVEGNIMEGNWLSGQTGWAVNLKTSAPIGMSWGIAEDITLRGNIIRNSGAGISLLGAEGHSNLVLNRVTVVDNLIANINTGIYTGAGNMVQALGGPTNITFDHNTFVTSGYIANAFVFTAPVIGFSFLNNIIIRGQYGFKAGGSSEGNNTLSQYAPGGDFRANLLIGNQPQVSYPQSTWWASNLSSVGFSDIATANYRLSVGSAFSSRGTDGRDLGADISLITTLTSAAIVP